MTTQSPHRTEARRPLAAWAGAAALTLGALWGASGAYAAAPPAKTEIGNVATAAYADITGTILSSQSNKVITTVEQVGAYTVTADNTRKAAAGTTVYMPHTLTNIGNGPDAFSLSVVDSTGVYDYTKIELFVDANGDGLPDTTTPLCSSIPPAPCTVTSTPSLNAGDAFKFVVAYTVPAGLPQDSTNTATVTVVPVPTSPILATYTPATLVNTDTITVTTAAAFSMTKTIAIPLVAAPGGGSWPAANTSGPVSAVLSTTACSTTYPVTQSSICDYTVYTLNYKNTGAAAGAFMLQDILPVGLDYVANSAVWSGAAGVALGDTGADPAGIIYSWDAGSRTIKAQIGTTAVAANPSDWVGPNISGTISFIVLIKPTALVGTSTTTNTATYFSTPIPDPKVPPTTPPTVPTNPSPFNVLATPAVVIGNAVATGVTGRDKTAGAADGSADLNTLPSIPAGGSVSFTQELWNTGNDTDTFNLSVMTNTFPVGTVFGFYAADGLTPLLDTNGDGKVDAGAMLLGTDRKIVVKASIPMTTLAGAGPFSLTVRAVSSAAPTALDATVDTVTIVSGILIDLTNTPAGTGSGTVGNGDAGQGPSPLPTTTNSTPAGTGSIFKLFLKNNDTVANTYALAASQTFTFPGSMPTGWTVKFVAAGAGCTGAAITTQPVAAGLQAAVDACVTPPVSAPIGVTTVVYFKVSSTTPTSLGAPFVSSDTKTDALTVVTALTFSATLTPDHNDQIAPGGTVVFAHVLTNTGAQSCGQYTLRLTETGKANGWTATVYEDLDNDGVLGPKDGPALPPDAVFPGPLAPNTSKKFLVKVFAPGGSVAGQQDTVVLTADFGVGATSCGMPAATDISTVVTGQIRVVKTQAKNISCTQAGFGAFSAVNLDVKPSQCINYHVVATNEGAAPINNLTVNDSIPNGTSTVGATQPAVQCSTSATGVIGTVQISPATGFNTLGGGTTIACATATSVQPGSWVAMDFSVRINPVIVPASLTSLNGL